MSGSTAAPAPTTTTTAVPRPGESTGAFVYRTQCAGCHGPTGEGNLGPELRGIASRLGVEAQVMVVRTGNLRMPAFSPALSEAEIRAVVAYTRSELPGPPASAR